MTPLLDNTDFASDVDARFFNIRNLGGLIPVPSGLVSSTDPRLSDQRVPLDGSVTDAKVAPSAGIVQSKLNLNGQIPLGWLGKTSGTAAEGDLAEYQINKGVANGYPSLDSTGHIPIAQLPTIVGGGTGTVTSVALTMPGDFLVAGSPITGSGTFAVTRAAAAAVSWFGNPSTSSAVPAFQTAAFPVALIPPLPGSIIASGAIPPAQGGVPPGGAINYGLVKTAAGDFLTGWAAVAQLGSANTFTQLQQMPAVDITSSPPIHLGQYAGGSYSGMWCAQNAAGATTTNYSVLSEGTNLYLNAPASSGTIQFRMANASGNVSVTSAGITGKGTVPPGGSTGQALMKTTGTDYDVGWANASGPVGAWKYLGSGTYTTPGGCRAVFFVLVAGGGGGGGANASYGSGHASAGGGGGGGGVVAYYGGPGSYTINVGTGGAGGAPGAGGGGGNPSYLSGICEATGGFGGQGGGTGITGPAFDNGGGAGGYYASSYPGNIANVQGSDGGYGIVLAGNQVLGGAGGSAAGWFGGGSAVGPSATGHIYGGGGAGAAVVYPNSATGGAGAQGVVWVQEFY